MIVEWLHAGTLVVVKAVILRSLKEFSFVVMVVVGRGCNINRSSLMNHNRGLNVV